MEFLPNLADKTKLQPNEERLALLQKLNRDTHKMVSIEDLSKVSHWELTVRRMTPTRSGCTC